MALGIDAVLTDIGGGLYDISFDEFGDIETADNFDTFILVALFTDARANASEISSPERRRGWLGNERTPGFEMGGKIWLYTQSRLTRSQIGRLEIAARNALQSMVDDNLATSIDAVRVSSTVDSVTLRIDIRRPNNELVTRYLDLWNATGVSN